MGLRPFFILYPKKLKNVHRINYYFGTNLLYNVGKNTFMEHMMKFIYPFMSAQVSQEKQKILEKHLFEENIQRCKLFAKIVILFESILIIMNIFSSVSTNSGRIELNIYLILYIILFVASSLMLVYMNWFERKKNVTEKQFTWFRFGLLCFVVFFLLWGTVVTLVDQKEYGHVMAFAVNVMCVSILFHASNRTMLSLYILPVSVLLIGMPFFQESNEILIGHYINLSVFLFFCWLASRMLYNSYSSNFFNKMLLTESNTILAAKMDENERINKELAEVNEQLKKMTLVDELTRIPNRRGFQAYIQEVLEAATQDRKLAILMVDIDAFKLFNDHYGHLEGDRIIKAVAQKLQNCMSGLDSITSRFGGEEFVIAVFDLDTPYLTQLAEKIRLAVLGMNIPHEYSPFSNQVTISIGITTDYVSSSEDIKVMMKDADNALYKSKELGRNRVEIWEQTP